jgi:tRNA-dihydrouridine synthase A
VKPLHHDTVKLPKSGFRASKIALSGGVTTEEQIAQHLQHVDGLMGEQQAHPAPGAKAAWDASIFRDAAPHRDRHAPEEAMVGQTTAVAAKGVPWGHASRHMKGLRNGQPGARRGRPVWSGLNWL